MPYSCQLQFGTSGTSDTPVGDGRILDALARYRHLPAFFRGFARDGRDFNFGFSFKASGNSSRSMRMALPKYTLRRSPSFNFKESIALMISRMKSGPPSGSKGQSVPKRTWSAPKKSSPQRVADLDPFTEVSA